MKKVLGLLFFAVAFTVSLSAQRTISGTVIDDSGFPVIGASVLVKGLDVGTITDIDGTYQLDLPAGSEKLVISYTGYGTQEIDVLNGSVFDITMAEGAVLDEIVVTGLGIKKEKKALGYGVSTIGADGIAERGETDVARILNGKATGVNIQQTSGLAGSGTNIIIRGYSSITGSNQPLFVVDGVPFNTDTNSDGSNFTEGSSTASSRFLDLDPNNIADISILKGLSATVLYGEAGRNGVILVTTKTGEGLGDEDDDLGISITQGFSVSQIANLPDYQNTFGNGFSGNYGAFFSNWGPSFDVRGSNGVNADGTIPHPYDNSRNADRLPIFAGETYEYRAYESVENLFDDGSGINTSINVDKKIGNTSFAASYSYAKDGGFTPRRGEVEEVDQGDGVLPVYNYIADGEETNVYEKHNISLGASTELGKGWTMKGSFNYLTSNRVNPPAASAGFLSTVPGGNASLFSDVLYTPRSIDLLHLPYEAADGSMVYYRGGAPIQNPLWTLNNTRETEELDRFFGRLEFGYEITDNVRLQFRAGIDQYTQNNGSEVNKGGSQLPDGRYNTSTRVNKIYDHVANLLYDFPLGDSDFTLDGVVGVNFRGETNDFSFLQSTEQFVFDLFAHQNFATQETFSLISNEKTNAVYGTATLGYKSYLYLGLQARNDWTSVLPEANRSVFYPSASVSFIPSELGIFNGTVIDYLKLRLGFGTSAGYPDPYVTSSVLATDANAFNLDGTVIQTNAVSTVLGNPNLQAEKINELEFGVEANLFKNRITLDASVYSKNSEDLLINLPLDPSTGYNSTTVNGASVSNNGVEIGLTVRPVTRVVNWSSTFNFTHNENTVESIIDGVDLVVIAGFNGLGNYAIPGEPYGSIYGTAFVTNDNGDPVVNSLGEYDETGEPVNIGDPNPNFTLDWINTISIGNFAFNIQMAYQDGGDVYSATALTLLGRGNTIDTDFNRFLPIVLPGVLADDTPNNIQTYAGDAWFSAFGAADEGAVFDATNIRIREISASYRFPDSIFEGSPFRDLSVKVYGNNIWYNAVNFPEGLNFDPEVLSLGVGNGRGFDLLTGPTSRRFGVSLNAKF